MSSTPMSHELSDADCKKGQVTQRPPILYAVSKNGLLVITLRETINSLSAQSILAGEKLIATYSISM